MNDPRQIWEVDYYAEILDLRERNRKLLELLKTLEHELCFVESAMCPVCGNYGHGPDCDLVKELGKGIIK